MGREKLILVMLLLLAIIGLSFLGNGISGMMVFDETLKQVCTSNDDCVAPDVCCLFYEQKSGVCHTYDMCGKILDVTKTEKETKGALITLKNTEIELEYNYIMQAVFGAVIVTLVAFSMYHFLTHSKHLTKRRKKRHSSKS